MRQVSARGFALIFVVGMLSLLSALCVAFVYDSQIERTLGNNFVLRRTAALLAESGVERALAELRADPETAGGAGRREFIWESGGENGPRERYTATLEDESGKLNLNDADGVRYDAMRPVEGRMAKLAGYLFGRVWDAARAERIVQALYGDPATSRASHSGDRFPHRTAVETALRAAEVTEAEIERFWDFCTLDTWQDPNVIETGLPVHGKDLYGAAPDGMTGETIDRWLEFQTREFRLQPRSPVNLNAAPVELLYALILPIQGVFLEEGPAETQSSEHYGWWATGPYLPYASQAPFVDKTVRVMGTVRRTRAFSEERAWRLAQAMHDRIHGVANPDLTDDDLQDADADGNFDPNSFETWEEFRHFLEFGITGGALAVEPAGAAYDIWIGTDVGADGEFNIDPDAHLPRRYSDVAIFRDPHAFVADPVIPVFANTWRATYASKPIREPYAAHARERQREEARLWLITYYARFQRDAVYANFNPNSLFNDWNPNRNAWVAVDKAQLTRASTEGSLGPTGVYGITSRGEVTAPNGRVLARASIACRLRAFETLRITSQAQFLEGVSPSGAMPGRELSSVFSEMPYAAARYGWAHHAPQSGRYGLTLQSYPEPVYADAAVDEAIRQAKYDGSILLADTEMQSDPDDLAAQGWGVCALGHFNGDDNKPLNLDSTGLAGLYSTDPGMLMLPSPEILQTAANRPHAGPLMSFGEAPTPGNLYPDGVYCESGRVAAYVLDVFHGPQDAPVGQKGAIAFWIKPNFHPGVSTRIRKWFCGPSRQGVYCPQTWAALMYLSNPASDEIDGTAGGGVPAFARTTLQSFWTRSTSPTRSFMPGGLGGRYGLSQRNYWTPTRGLIFGYAWQNGGVAANRYTEFMQGSCDSGTVCRDFPLASLLDTTRGFMPQAIAAHCWSRITLGWDHERGRKRWMFAVNGQSQANEAAPVYLPTTILCRSEDVYNPYLQPGSQNSAHEFSDDLTGEYFRFGELPGLETGNEPGYANRFSSPYAADATIDEIECMYRNTDLALTAGRRAVEDGRYLGNISQWQVDEQGLPVAGIYTSPAYSLQGIAEAGTWLELRAVAWTCYRPTARIRAGAPYGIHNTYRTVAVNTQDKPDPMLAHWAENDQTPGIITDRLTWDPMSLDITDPSGAWRFQQWGMQHRLTYPGGSVLPVGMKARYETGDVFQFRAYFHVSAGQKNMHESPVLDDVTVTFWRLRPAILEWSAR